MSIKTVAKIFASLAGVIVVVLMAMAGFLLYMIDEDHLTASTREYLAEVLDTEVELKKAKFQPFNNAIAIYGFNIKDRQRVDMLHVDTLEVNIDFWKLFRKEVVVYGFHLAGANAVMYKENPDTAANYQFVIDALHFTGQKKKDDKDDAGRDKADKDKDGFSKKPIIVDLRNVTIARTSATWDVRSKDSLNTPDHKQLDLNHLRVSNLDMKMNLQGGGAPGSFVGELDHLKVEELNSHTAIFIDDISFDCIEYTLDMDEADFVYQDKHLNIKELSLRADDIKVEQKTSLNSNIAYALSIESIDFQNGIGVSKKERGPRKGAFDAKHCDISASLNATVTCLTPDSLSMAITRLTAKDKTSGLSLDNATMMLYRYNGTNTLRKLHIASGRNLINIDNVEIIEERYGKNRRKWSFKTSTVHCRAMLQDIAHSFAPVLQNFTTPIFLKTKISGNADAITFSNVLINNDDRRLQISADGTFLLPKHKGEKIVMRYNIHNMSARGGIKEQIISHFGVKENALKFISSLGDVTYKGTFVMPWHRQIFNGKLTTRYGSFDVEATLNNETCYLTGKIATEDFRLGEYIGNKNIGDVSLNADVTMDIASKRKAKLLHRKKGKIPAGTIKGRAGKASYKFVSISDVDFNIVSDATIAKGSLATTGKLMDIACDFSFDEADIKNSLKVKPHIKLHNPFHRKKEKGAEDSKDTTEKKSILQKIFKKKDKNKE